MNAGGEQEGKLRGDSDQDVRLADGGHGATRRNVAPSGRPVSFALTLAVHESQTDAAREALAAIDSVHGDGDLRQVPVMSSDSGDVGAYFWNVRTREPLRIELKRGQTHPRLTLLHEVGHLLDHQTLGVRGFYESERSVLSEGRLVAWRRAVEASPGVKRGRKLLKQKNFDVPGSYGKKERLAVPKRVLGELLSPPELFARSYGQYIALRSSNQALLTELSATLDRRDELCFCRQWVAEDFEPIARVLDALFEELGWVAKLTR